MGPVGAGPGGSPLDPPMVCAENENTVSLNKLKIHTMNFAVTVFTLSIRMSSDSQMNRFSACETENTHYCVINFVVLTLSIRM